MWAQHFITLIHIPLLGSPKAEKYYLGIVDVLTYYGTKKRTAHAAKTVKHGVRSNLVNVIKYKMTLI